MERTTITTIEELKKISSDYHYEYFDTETGILELDFPYDEEEKWGHFDFLVEYQLEGEALAFAQEEERQYVEIEEEEEDIFGAEYNFCE